MPFIETEPTYDVYCIIRRQYQRHLNIFLWDVSVAQLVASLSAVVLGGGVKVVGSNLEYIYIHIALCYPSLLY